MVLLGATGNTAGGALGNCVILETGPNLPQARQAIGVSPGPLSPLYRWETKQYKGTSLGSFSQWEAEAELELTPLPTHLLTPIT